MIPQWYNMNVFNFRMHNTKRKYCAQMSICILWLLQQPNEALNRRFYTDTEKLVKKTWNHLFNQIIIQKRHYTLKKHMQTTVNNWKPKGTITSGAAFAMLSNLKNLSQHGKWLLESAIDVIVLFHFERDIKWRCYRLHCWWIFWNWTHHFCHIVYE